LQPRRLESEKKPDELDDSIPPLSAASAAGIFAEGSRFGTYVIGPCIGHGGMARIYRAEHQGLQRQVALKVLIDAVAPGTEGRARFLREARIAAAIKHPNVVNIFDIGVESRIPYLVMELLVGQDLEALLQSQSALSEASIIDIAVPVVAGLVAVHDAGVVHRDLKPGNIFLSRGQHDEVQPKLLDFGISRATGGDKLRLTSTQGLLMGTPLYMSPEALMGADMTALSDQYSLGVVLYEAATGINPFVADNVGETIRRVTTGAFPPLAEHAIRPSRRLAAIIERAMSLDPRDRFPDMRALGQELLTLAGQRTRITWGLTFGEVAASSRPRAELPPDKFKTAQTLRRATNGMSLAGWPKAVAAVVGVASLAALLRWSVSGNRGVEPSSNRGSADLSGAPVQSEVRSLTPREEPLSRRVPAAAAMALPAQLPAPAAAVEPRIAPAQEPPANRSTERSGDPEPVAEAEPAEQEAQAVEEEEDQERSDRSASRPRQRPPAVSRPAPARPRPDPPSPQPVEESAEAPEWIISPSSTGRARSSRKPVTSGTNDALIFD
jgi:eukaryotic-like serine/threonine-protein kinase